MRVDVEERVPDVAAGERLAFAQLVDVVQAALDRAAAALGKARSGDVTRRQQDE